MKTMKELKKERLRAAHRQRRVIVDNDSHDVCLAQNPTEEDLLRHRAIPQLADCVDAVCYLANHLDGFFIFPTETLEVYTEPHPAVGGNIGGNITKGLIARGKDAMGIMTDFYHGNNRELFAGFRMNDVHDAGLYICGMVCRWKWEMATGKIPNYCFGSLRHDPAEAKAIQHDRADPKTIPVPDAYWEHLKTPYCEYVVDQNPPEGLWSSLDYAAPEIRNKRFSAIEEMCRRYDVDGIHLLFMKTAPYFKSVAWGNPISPEETEGMTDLMRRIRRMTEEVGLERGRPLLVAVQPLASVTMNEAQGLDIVRWLEEDLVDILIPGWSYEAPWGEMIALGRSYDRTVYPQLYQGSRPLGVESERANALNMWAAGGDGIYMWNYYSDIYKDLFGEVGHPDRLQKMNKVYSVLPHGLGEVRRARNVIPLIKVPAFPGIETLIQPGDSLPVGYFPVADDVFRPGGNRGHVALLLKIMFQNIVDERELTVTMNGAMLSGGIIRRGKEEAGNRKSGENGAPDMLEFVVPTDIVRWGNNRFEIQLKEGASRAIRPLDLQLHVKYNHGKTD